jgi:PPOX class probable F420-dependent enzyme
MPAENDESSATLSAVAFSDEERDFLLTATRTGKLGYTASDGRPLIAPIWFVIDDGDIVFNTGETTAKGKALARDPRVVLCVDLEEPPYAFIQIQGVVELNHDPEEARRTATLSGARYMGADRAEEMGERNGVPGELTVRIKATKVISHFNMAG